MNFSQRRYRHNIAVNWTASTLRIPAASYFSRWAKLQ
jgi:hypothetical protein